MKPDIKRIAATALLYTFGYDVTVFACARPLLAQPAAATRVARTALAIDLAQPAIEAEAAASPAAAAAEPERAANRIDLRTWLAEGDPAAAEWQVAADGGSVTTTRASGPGFFVSPTSFLNATLRARVKVSGAARGSFGVLLDYQQPLRANRDEPTELRFTLFDWTSAKTPGAATLQGVRSTAMDPRLALRGPGAQRLAAGKAAGWEPNKEYDLLVRYRRGRVSVSIDGQEVVSHTALMTRGRMGLYTNGQAGLSFRDVSIRVSNAAPVANAGPDQTLDATAGCAALVTLDGSRSTDPDGDVLTYRWTGPFGAEAGEKPVVSVPRGAHVITLAVDDGNGGTAEDTVEVEVVDREAPSITCPASVNVAADPTTCKASGVALGTPVVSDNCSVAETSSSAPAQFPLGRTVVNWNATDSAGFYSSCAQEVTVLDRTAPSLSVTLAQSMLWPADHKLTDVGLVAQTSDSCGGTPSVFLKVYADEPENNQTGDGNAWPDAVIRSPKLELRRERRGDADGRVYLVIVKAADAAGNQTTACKTSLVPKSQSPAHISAVRLQGENATRHCEANGTAPNGYTLLTEGYLSRTNLAPRVDAGADQTIAQPTQVATLAGSVTDDGLPAGAALTTQWTLKDGPAPVTFANPSAASTTVTVSEPGRYVLRLSATDSALSSYDEMVLTVLPPNQAPSVSAGPDRTLAAAGGSVTLLGAASDDGLPAGSTLATQWTKVSGPGEVTFADGSLPATQATFSVLGTYVLRLTASDGQLTASDEVTVRPQNSPPTVDAGADQTITLPTSSVSLAGSVTDDGLPEPPALSVHWSLLSGPAPVSFSAPDETVTQATFSAGGVYEIELLASDSAASARDRVSITVNRAPTADAGADTVIDLPVSTVGLSATATDDQLPNPALSFQWTVLEGPAAVTFSAPQAAQTAATFSAGGLYRLQVEVSDGAASARDTVTVIVNAAPAVDAGADQTLPAGATTTTLQGTATDDGLPPGSSLAVTWSLQSGPGTATLGTPTALQTAVEFSTAGEYQFRLTATDGRSPRWDEVTVVVAPAALPALAIEGASVDEGATGLTDAVFTVALSEPAEVTVDYRTEPMEASEECDFQYRAGTLTFTAGATQQQVRVPVVGDLASEGEERFRVHLGNPVGAVIVAAEGLGRIQDDDAANQPPLLALDAPADGSSGVGASVDLTWSASDPEGEALAYDVYFGTQAGLGGQHFARICAGGTGAGARSGAASAYDEANDRLLVVGGRTAGGDTADVHVLSDASGAAGVPAWAEVPVAAGPAPRHGASAVYDAAEDRLILFGGCTGACEEPFADAWVLSGTTSGAAAWLPLPDAPSGRALHGAGYDPASRRLIVYGGDEVLLLLDANGLGTPAWQPLPTSGTSPGSRKGAGVAYDAATNRLFVFGGLAADGTARNDLWVLSHANGLGGAAAWTKTAVSGSAPAPRFGHSVAYDPSTDRLLVFGGAGTPDEAGNSFIAGDVWMLVGAGGPAPAWSRIQVPLGGGEATAGRVATGLPAARTLGLAAYSSLRNRLVLALGEDPRTQARYLDDLWILHGAAGSLPLVSAAQSESTFTVDAPSTTDTYFWKIVARDAKGAEVGSPVRSFRRNAPPVVDAGPDGAIVQFETATLSGSATDDGLPSGSLTLLWSKLSGPGEVAFSAPTAPQTAASFGAAGTYVLELAGDDSLARGTDTVTVVVQPRALAGRTYTTDADFREGVFINAETLAGELKLTGKAEAFNLLWVAVSGKGTIVKIDTRDGRVLGEYWSSPLGEEKNPSRTTVDYNGAVWAANRGGTCVGLCPGWPYQGRSVVHIATPESGLCVDRNGNGRIDSSTGLGDVRPWLNAGGADTNGGVSTAQDECVIHYVKPSAYATRHVSITPENDVWVGGIPGSNGGPFDLIDGATGLIKRHEDAVGRGGYGGVLDRNGILWSTNRNPDGLFRWDTKRPLRTGSWTFNGPDGYGVCMDSQGNVWVTQYQGGRINKYAPSGAPLGSFTHGASQAQGCVVDRQDHVWVAHSLNQSTTVGHLLPDGRHIGNVSVGGAPTGVALDAAGYIWSTNLIEQVAARIDPNAGELWPASGPDPVTGRQYRVGAVNLKTVDLGGQLYNYSDMTGAGLTAAPLQGTWTVVFDSGIAGAEWAPLRWAGTVTNDGELIVKAATSDSTSTFGDPLLVGNGEPHALPRGRYAQIVVQLVRSTAGESPKLGEISIGTVGYGFPAPVPNDPPAVNAGPDQSVRRSDPATLAGQVHDTDTLQLGWAQQSGPGRVVFADPAQPATTVKVRKSEAAVAQDDFSSSANPNGPWSYGFRTAGVPFTLGSARVTAGAFPSWSGDQVYGADRYPAVGRSTAPSVLQVGYAWLPAGELLLQPAPNGDKAVLRWTAPFSGTFRIEGRFAGTTVFPTTADVSVEHAGAVAFSAALGGVMAAQSFALTRTVSAGQPLDFIVGYGSNGNADHDLTAVVVSVTPEGALGPEGAYRLRLSASDGALDNHDELELSVLPRQPLDASSCLVSWLPGDGTTRDLVTNVLASPSPGVTYAPGVSGQAFSFNGASWVRIDPTPLPGTQRSFTVEAWIKVDDVNRRNPIFEFNPGTGGYPGVSLWVAHPPHAGSGVEPGSLMGSYSYADASTVIFAFLATRPGLIRGGLWTHVAASYDAPTHWGRFYVNGQKEYEADLGPINATTSMPLFVGARPTSPWGGVGFQGLIDEFSVYNCALSDAQVREIAANGETGKLKDLNDPPVVEAGPRQFLMPPTLSTTLSGTVTDDGFPRGSAVSGAWSVFTKPAGSTVSFGNASSSSTTVSFSGAGDYVLRLTGTDGQLNATDDVLVRVWPTNAAPTVDAGADQLVTIPPGTADLTGRVTDDDLPVGNALVSTWSKLSGPGEVTFADPAALATTATFSVSGAYTLQIQGSDGALSAADTVVVVVNAPPVVDGGGDLQVEVNSAAALHGTATDDGLPAGSAVSVQWSIVSGPGAVTFSDTTTADTQATFAAVGTYVLRLTASDTRETNSNDITIVVYPTNEAPRANAGPDRTVTLPPGTFPLSGSVSDDDLPPNRVLTSTWTVVGGDASRITIADPSAPSTTATATKAGVYTFRLTVTDGKATAFDEARIVVDQINAPPDVEAGPNRVLLAPVTSLTLAGSATDDGFPEGAPFTTTWTVTSGGGVTFADASSPTTEATFAAPGQYVLRLTASDTEHTVFDEMAVSVVAENQAPTVSAGPDQGVEINPGKVVLNGNVQDDGAPNGTLTVAWTQVSGPAAVVFSHPSNPGTFATFSAAGTYELLLSATDGEKSASDSVVVTVTPINAPPVVEAGSDQTLTLPTTTATLAGSVTDDGLPYGSTLSIQWQAPAGASVVFGSPNQATTTASFPPVPGTYTLGLVASDGRATIADTVRVTLVSAPAVGNPPSAAIASPLDATLTVPVPVTGTAKGDMAIAWHLDHRRDGDTNWVTFAQGSNTVENGTLGTFDPTMLLNGVYSIRLVVTDAAGRSRTATSSVITTGELKIGQFTVSFTDLEESLSGLPIQVTRTYDSRDKGQGDFGYGWRLDLKNIVLSEKGTPGIGWVGSTTVGWFPNYCMRAAGPLVTVTFPGGKVYEFEPYVTPECQMIPPNEHTVRWRARPGTYASLEALDTDGAVVNSGGWPSQNQSVPMQLFNWSDWSNYDPNIYKLTLRDGTAFVIDQNKGGLQTVTNLRGDVLTFTPNGITHSAGRSVVFTRDTAGRITAVTDAEGKAIRYTYDANGDLVTVRDREDNPTTFIYVAQPAHHLKEIKDALGRAPIRNEYYPDGRIKSHTDAFGKTITYDHSTAANQEIVTDRNGKSRVLEYDARGNVTKEIQPDGRQVLRTFDARNNRLTETEPHDPSNADPAKTSYTYDGEDHVLSVTDANNNKTEYTYDAKGRVLTTKDPRGKVTTNTYHAAYGLLTTTDPAGTITSNIYDETSFDQRRRGRLVGTTVKKADGTVLSSTAYDHDFYGHVTRETDALGGVTTFSSTPAGLPISETRTRTLPNGQTETLTTVREYNDNGQLVKTTDADGTFTRAVYNALGQQIDSYDRLGHKASYTYDDMGRLSGTIYPDGKTEESTYDGEGRRLTSKDKAGRTTRYEYDDTGRLVKTTYPDNTFTETRFDAAGRVEQTIDARLKSTFFFYDTAGRRTKVMDALNQETSFTYDAAGNQLSVKDAKSQTTTNEYDELNRRTKTIFPDDSFTTTSYDELGRRSAETDQAGRTTRFEYDALGRLIKVIDARLKETTYGYDEVGNRIWQKDANDHVTRFEYDKQGRETARVLPGGKRETREYDAAGNLKKRTDFMGRATTYHYDVSGRLTARVYPDDFAVSFTYTASGRRETATDARGTTSYAYDGRDRLEKITYPDGRALEFGYDASGNRIRLTAVLANGSRYTTTYTYDELNRLDLVKDLLGREYDHGYDRNGNRESLAFPNGTLTSYTYNSLNRLTNLTTTHPASGRMLQSYALTLGPTGNRTKIEEHDGHVREYGYDELYRLVTEKVTLNAVLDYEKAFTYDDVGNRLQQVTTGSGAPGSPTAPDIIDYTYDDRDRLTLEGAQEYGWDDNGNLTSKDAEATYTWDFENRLTKIAKSGGTVVEYAYDVDGARVQTTTTLPGQAAQVKNYLVDTSGSLSHVVAETDAAGSLQALYVRGDDLLAVMRPAGVTTWTSRFYAADHIGSIRRLTDETGNVTDGYTYSAFGEVLAHTGTDPQPYAFAGESLDPNTGFQYHRARWMDPTVGRFASVDPFGAAPEDPAALHRYLYASAGPLNATDPTGFFSLPQALGVASIVGALSGAVIGGIRGGVSQAVDGAIAGAFAGPITVLAIFGVGEVIATIFGVTAATGQAIVAAGYTIVGAAEAGHDLYTAETPRERLAAGTALAFVLITAALGAKYGDPPVNLKLKYRPDWTPAQRAAADAKVRALNDATDLVWSEPARAKTSARARYEEDGNTVSAADDVDHIRDLQLGGKDILSNLWPLDKSVNRSLGSQIWHLLKYAPYGTRVRGVSIGD